MWGSGEGGSSSFTQSCAYLYSNFPTCLFVTVSSSVTMHQFLGGAVEGLGN